ncbi:riboflavin kinase / FMN adenylyltransferase [Enhydrobacter aerosaccus]|uniref:Riboflavin biosynthesis protein n=1 Tax=Enhydrobacter aerosaccus TaxID=225324 RepID=A0A1T4SUN8_9HYPH|nr:bifunctional riboflavin kinase/FAD synthetase [Enhydrobacter aerosaccus]SKA31866.1 riboflavin kinase / FMN adenylyltransferase [Enhydrobacter aerosaccus]
MIPVFDHWRHVPAASQNGVVALGNFDGVHRGHQALVQHAVEQAKVLGVPMVALTFEPHPRRFFVPDTAPFRLTLSPAKVRLLEQCGVQAVLEQRFDEAFASLSADAFVDDVLLAGLGVRHVVCGYDFTFGARRGGNVEKLRKRGRERGFAVTVLEPVMREGEIYSSTRIREALRAGWASEAAELLGRQWEIEGIVEHGDQRGRAIGFPTANVALGEHLRPRFGVYAVRALIDGKWIDGVANLGKRPTIGKLQENFEVNLFDFSGDLYGKVLRVALVEFIRPEMKFSGLEQLKAQIAADGQAARSILANGKPAG